ncbi:MAG: M36 family metallopeptidase [Desulfomonile tiedjei]|nr:M36 family metallopeptidase [Desulfomonile tiedjei]
MSNVDKLFPENFHALYDAGYRVSKGTRPAAVAPATTAGHERLSTDVPDLQVDYDEATQLPVRIVRREPAGRLSTQPADTAEEAVTEFVKNRGDLWELTPEDTATVEVVSVSRQGLSTVRLIQRIEGKEVFSSELSAVVSPSNEVISLTGRLFPGTAAARTSARASVATSEGEAIAKAALDITGVVYEPTDFSRADAQADSGPYRFYGFMPKENETRPQFDRLVRLKEVMFPLGQAVFVPGYYMEIWIKGCPAFSYVIDSVDTPDVLFRKRLTSDIAFKYRVHNTGDAVFRPEDGPAPGTPHPTGVPDGFQAPPVPEKLVEIESLLSGRPWLPPDADITRGNNCVVYADLKAPNHFGAGDVFAQANGPRTFDYSYDHTKPAGDPNNLQSSLVGMFFHVNWLHDRWYEAGFDEASGNAQQDKFGLGIGGDPILAEGNDYSGHDNANMATPAEGSSPLMQMFEFRNCAPEFPSRTSNHEALITFHEMGHYITGRLVGNANGLWNPQGRAMGEGWGDFFAICMTSQATDNFATGVFAAGGWTDVRPNFRENYYFSIRRYPYSVDMTKNPLTFKHISNNVILPSGPPRNPRVPNVNSEAHNAGEVWCSVLWEVFVNLVAKHGHAEAEKRMLKYVVGGLKQTPSMPTFTQARDGIITAVSALQPEELPEVWAGFAKRGMGVNAVSPPSSSTSLVGVVESFDTP